MNIKDNIGKYGLVTNSVVAGFNNKIGKIIDIWENKNGRGYVLKFPTTISPNNIDTLYPHYTNVEVINKIYTLEDAEKITHDIDVLDLPKCVWCDSKETMNIIANKFTQMHIGTYLNYELLFIQT